MPKLFVNAEPGAILVGAQREFCRAWPNQPQISVKAAISSRKLAGSDGGALADWYRGLG